MTFKEDNNGMSSNFFLIIKKEKMTTDQMPAHGGIQGATSTLDSQLQCENHLVLGGMTRL